MIWSEVPVYLAGVIVAAVVGYACIRLLKMIADKGSSARLPITAGRRAC